MEEIYRGFLDQLYKTGTVELIAVIFGIISVYFSRKENIWVYPTGLVNTLFYVYLSFNGHLFGEAAVNMYYSVMSVYGWVLWARKDRANQPLLHITFSTRRDWFHQLLFFAAFYLAIFACLSILKKQFAPGALPMADAFASATAFTGMWLMARKKVESWYWWLATNIASIPLYYVKDYVLTSVYYLILLIMAISGLIEWKRRARELQVTTNQKATYQVDHPIS